jgi:hypothetical protein
VATLTSFLTTFMASSIVIAHPAIGKELAVDAPGAPGAIRATRSILFTYFIRRGRVP